MKVKNLRYYERRLRRKTGQAIADYSMIKDGDRVIAAISGGKDSIVLLKLLHDLQKAAPLDFEVIPVHISTGYEVGFERISEWCKRDLGMDMLVVDSKIAEIMDDVADPGKSPCALCARLRRGKLYELAEELGADSIALGHHMDDIIETFLLRTFFTGQAGAMAPARVSNDGRNRVIRPMAACSGEMVLEYFKRLELDAVENKCIIRKDSKRDMIRAYLSELERDIPEIKHSIFAALGNIDMRSLCIKEGSLESNN